MNFKFPEDKLQAALFEKKRPWHLFKKEPTATWLDEATKIYEERPIAHIRNFFLPLPSSDQADEPADFEFPCPNTTTFRNVYCEPLNHFQKWCRAFSRSVSISSEWRGTSESPAADLGPVKNAYLTLNGLAQATPYALSFDPDQDRINEEHVSSGLLSSYALMFLWDRMEGRRALSCENCSKRFVSNEQRAKYCSATCRNTAQSRRYRQSRSLGRNDQGVSE